MSVTIEILTKTIASNVHDVVKLLSQLRSEIEEHTASLSELEYIATSKDIKMIVALDGERIVGMASLYILQKLGKRTGIVEDVVVDSEYRGQGLGVRLMEMVIDTARHENLKSISLTSRPERVAGNSLYQKLGFEKKETNVYRMTL